jgi:ABC-type polysaccharide transport system permease subunit
LQQYIGLIPNIPDLIAECFSSKSCKEDLVEITDNWKTFFNVQITLFAFTGILFAALLVVSCKRSPNKTITIISALQICISVFLVVGLSLIHLTVNRGVFYSYKHELRFYIIGGCFYLIGL